LISYAVGRPLAGDERGIMFDGHPIPTDEQGRGLVSGAYLKALRDPAVTKRWQVSAYPITFITFSNAQLVALGLAVESLRPVDLRQARRDRP
jgi:hypothetical protein